MKKFTRSQNEYLHILNRRSERVKASYFHGTEVFALDTPCSLIVITVKKN